MLDNLDLGDVVGAEGKLIRTRTGELSLMADGLTLLAKARRGGRLAAAADLHLVLVERYAL